MGARSITYAALGDSTGAGVGARRGGGYVDRLAVRMREGGATVRLVNLCQSGADTGDVLRGQLGRALAAEPTLVTLGIGINDVTGSDSDAEFGERFARIASELEALGVPVVVANVPDFAWAPAVRTFPAAMVRGRITAFNARIADASRRHGLVLVDLYAQTERILATSPGAFCPDGFHPSDEGYEAWALAMWPAVAAALGG